MFPVRRQISPHAARLRRDMTDAERMLWSILRNRQLDGFKFRRQATIDPFVVDFLCVEAALAVELDGGQHDEDRDRRRTVYLEARSLHILRFWNHDVVEDIEGVADAIRSALSKKKTLTQPSPAKAGEG
ncbi:endonuclease domain-containing protein [Sphingobium sp. BHU LFT2]|uniref:endonuclease domain-containing protein n=1 Tax=Sphingobium sp. BHU LFT2 TaxID=2807634 RepID=UPI001BE92A36|nr:endonuclease domain-containing protein [Sphingobium sp. BHU LFT2]MBT2245560.1 endonuclease domain-containing protein [Sphingobium sp. BHU LFT2]